MFKPGERRHQMLHGEKALAAPIPLKLQPERGPQLPYVPREVWLTIYS